MTTKRCFKCMCDKPLEDFYAHAKMRDGRLNKCIECTKRDVAEHRQANLERLRAYDRLRASTHHRVAARKEYAQQARADLEAEVKRLKQAAEELQFLTEDLLYWTERAVGKGNANCDIEEAWERYEEWCKARAALESKP